jgi:nucleoside-diphosphate-sugar epimerase
MEFPAARTILVTGISGVIGRAIAEALPEDTVIGLAHSDTDLPATAEIVHGDLGQPRLGLPEATWHELAERIDVIVHSGALTAWGQARELYQAINIDGTAQVVELARAANAPIHLLSTCFVHAIERDALDLMAEDNVVRPYIWSKLESEKLVAASGLPYSVFRPTNLIGDSRTGASSRPQIVQTMSDFICRGKAPYFPVHPGNLMDFVPLDVTVDAVVRAIRSDDLRGQVYWLTYGPDAMTVAEAQEILIEHARTLGRDLGEIPVIDPSGPLPVPLAEIPATSRTFLKVLIDVSEVTRSSGGVLPCSLPELGTRLGVAIPSDRQAYRLSLKYWADVRAAAREKVRETI